MDPVGSGWPYAYNRLVASGHLSSGSTSGHNTNAVASSPLIVQPTATPAYGSGPFLPPPSVGYDVFSTLFHPSAVAAQMNSQANLKSVNYNATTNQAAQQQHEQSNSSSSQNQRTQQCFENTSRTVASAGPSNWSSSANGTNQQQQLQFGLSTPNSNLVPQNPSSNTGSNTLATITRVNSNGGGGTCSSPASTVYDNYNVQLQKAHSLYLNSQLANAAAMAAMASKIQEANAQVANASRPAASPQVATGNSAFSGGNNNYNQVVNDRPKTQQNYVNETGSAKNVAATTISMSNSSSSGHGTSIPLAQFEAAKQKILANAVVPPQQSSPISYSMWDNNSPVQNKFSCQQQSQQQQQNHQFNQRKVMQTPSPVSSAFTRQPQHQNMQSDVSHSLQQEAIYINHRLKTNSSTESQFSNQGGQRNDTSSPVVVPRRPSPMQNSQASPIGHAASPAYPMYNSPMNMSNNNNAYSATGSSNGVDNSMGSNSSDGYNSNQQNVNIRENARLNTGADLSVGYSSVIQRVAGTAWEQNRTIVHSEKEEAKKATVPKKRKSTQSKSATEEMEAIGNDNQRNLNKQIDSWSHPAAVGNAQLQQPPQSLHQQQNLQQQMQQINHLAGKYPNANNASPLQNSYHNSALLAQHVPVLSTNSAFGAVQSNLSNNNRSYLPHQIVHHQQQQQQQQNNLHQQRLRADEEEEELERQVEQQKQQKSHHVVVPNIMEELNFLSAAATTKKPEPAPPNHGESSRNHKVQILSVEKTNKAIAQPPENKFSFAKKKDKDEGFIGSYLKFLQGERSSPPPSYMTNYTTPRPRKMPARADQSGKKFAEDQNDGRRNMKKKKVEENEEKPQNGQNNLAVDAVKVGRGSADNDQGYVPNGGLTAPTQYDQPYHQQLQSPYIHPSQLPLGIPSAHQSHYAQGHGMPSGPAAVPISATGNAQLPPPQSYSEEAGGFNYFDFQFRPRW